MSAASRSDHGKVAWDGVSTHFAFRYAPEVLEWETAPGWMRRACRSNGQPSLPPVALQLGLNHRYLSPEACLRIAANSRAPGLDDLVANTARHLGNSRIRVRSESMSVRHWSIRKRRYCPACLHESPHHRLFWDFTFFLTCPVHGVPVLGDEASGSVTWAPTDLMSDHEGHFLPRAAPKLAEPRQGFELFAMGRLGAFASIGTPLLDGLDLGQAHHAVRTVGCLLAHPVTKARPVIPTFSDEAVRISDAGFEALRGDARHLRRRLDDLVESRIAGLGARAEVTLDGLFGWAATAVRNVRHPLLSLVDACMREAASKTGRVRRTVLVPPAEGMHPAMLTLKDVSGVTGLPRLTTKRMAEHLGIAPKDAKRERAYLSLEDAELIRSALAEGVEAETLASALGLRRGDLSLLEQRGHLLSLPARRPGTQAKLFPPSALTLLDGLVDGLAAPKGPSVGFMAHAEHLSVEPGELACRVLEGGCIPIGRHARGTGFRRLRFAGTPGARSRSPGFSFADAGFRLGVPVDTVRWLVEVGRLRVDGGVMPRGGIGIEEASVESLDASFVAVRTLVGKNGETTLALARRLRSRGICVIARSEAHQGLARRSDVLDVLPELAAASGLAVPAAPIHSALPAIRAIVAKCPGSWRVQRDSAGDRVTLVSSNRKVTVGIAIGDGLLLWTDCTPGRSSRRSRILSAASGPPSDFRIVREGKTVRLEAHATRAADTVEHPDGVLSDFLPRCLSSLFAVFGSASADRRNR